MNIREQKKGIALILAAALALGGCGEASDGGQTEEESAIAVKAVSAEMGSMAVSNQFIGTVSPQQQVSIIPLVSGEVDAVYAQVGDEVEAGDVLFHIKDDAARLQKESAELSRQGAELSAQMQLGSGQTMSNLQLLSNIRSVQYQLDMAKDQYSSAATGIADAQEARDQMDSALQEINGSIGNLQSQQKQMESVIEQAKQYVEYDLINGKWKYKEVYTRSYDPDHYTWSNDPAGLSEQDIPEDVPQQDAGNAANEGTDTQPANEGAMPGDFVEPADEDSVEETADSLETARADAGSEYAYFSVELIRESEPVYLAENEDPEPDKVPRLNKTREEAWNAYYEQQEINAARDAAAALGYDAEGIGTGKAQAEVLESSAQIVALQYQASQIQSGQSSLEGNIKSGESALGTTEKTIDFYEDNLETARATWGLQNGQAYEDTQKALETQIRTAEVGVKSAEMQLEYYSPTTPISGTVVSKTVEQYGMVQPGYAAYVISNQDAMNVTFGVSGQVRASLQIGMPVTLEKNGNTYTGTITEIGETVDQQTGGLFLVKAVTEADGDVLASGTSVKLTVDTFRTDNAVLIPYDAVHFESEQAYVFVIQDHRAVRTPVTVGLMNDDRVEITEGLDAGSQVVASWSSQLEDGALVRLIGESSTKQGAEPDGSDAQDSTQEADE